jgi:hypothetical protein
LPSHNSCKSQFYLRRNAATKLVYLPKHKVPAKDSQSLNQSAHHVLLLSLRPTGGSTSCFGLRLLVATKHSHTTIHPTIVRKTLHFPSNPTLTLLYDREKYRASTETSSATATGFLGPSQQSDSFETNPEDQNGSLSGIVSPYHGTQCKSQCQHIPMLSLSPSLASS